MDTRLEQRLLKLSITVTVAVGTIGLASGLLIQSQAIVFDGMYSLVDVVLTTGSLALSRLLASEGSSRFQYGYWHLEPMVEAFGGAIMALACIYAAINGINGLLSGGHDTDYGFGAIWAGLLCLVSMSMAFYVRRRARRMRSGLLSLDARGWLVSGFLSMALLLAFAGAVAIEGTSHGFLIPYLDSATLLVIALAMLPVPMVSTWRAVVEVLQVAPSELDRLVKQSMQEMVEEHGFLGYTSHVAKIGRARFVEVHVLVPPNYEIGSIERIDRVRNHLSQRLDADASQLWLTVDVTADPAWF
jgi:predicted Co/Zn/Cd cation transporter (cation efflux family)